MRNKRKQAVALALAAALCLSLSIPAEAAGGFLDVAPGAYYAEAVDWAVEQGIAKGVSETAFAPDQTCTGGRSSHFCGGRQGRRRFLQTTWRISQYRIFPETTFSVTP